MTYIASYYKENRDSIRASQSKYYKNNRETLDKKHKEWAESHPMEFRKIMRKALNKWNSNNLEKRRAHRIVFKSLKLGTLKKPRFCECGNTGIIHGHHDDYSKPLEVKWLCYQCHRKVHR